VIWSFLAGFLAHWAERDVVRRMRAPVLPHIICHQCGEDTLKLYPALPEDDVPERWLCKWCGYYWSEQYGERQCVPDYTRGVWMFKEDATDPAQPTPREECARLAEIPGI
jgi:transposase-like protein